MEKNLSDIINQNVNSLSHLFNNRSQVINRIEICETCKGEGSIEVSAHIGHTRGYDIQDQVCANCKGSGRIDIEITIRMKPHKIKQHETAKS